MMRVDYSPDCHGTREIGRDGDFIAYNNGTVLDTRTNLMWAAKDNGYGINWQDAKNYCKNYWGGGYQDWRMPTVDELAGLYDEGKRSELELDNDFEIHLTELIRLTDWWPWASETYGSEDAYNFSFLSSLCLWNPQSYHSRVLPVRRVALHPFVQGMLEYAECWATP